MNITPTIEQREINTRMKWKTLISRYKRVPKSKIKEFEKDKLYLDNLKNGFTNGANKVRVGKVF